jgi:hypothetical protein
LTNNAADIIRLGIIPPAGRRVVLQQVQAKGVVSTDNINIYGILRSWSGANDDLGNSVTSNTNVWSQVDAGAGTLGYIPSQYHIAPWIEFKTNNTPMSLNAGGLMTNPVMGSSYDGRVVISLGATGSTQTETTSDLLQVQAMLK